MPFYSELKSKMDGEWHQKLFSRIGPSWEKIAEKVMDAKIYQDLSFENKVSLVANKI